MVRTNILVLLTNYKILFKNHNLRKALTTCTITQSKKEIQINRTEKAIINSLDMICQIFYQSSELAQERKINLYNKNNKVQFFISFIGF